MRILEQQQNTAWRVAEETARSVCGNTLAFAKDGDVLIKSLAVCATGFHPTPTVQAPLAALLMQQQRKVMSALQNVDFTPFFGITNNSKSSRYTYC